jgi:hypothetical protein
MLAPIFSCRYPIRLLTLDYTEGKFDIRHLNLDKLNLSSIKQLSLYQLNEDQLEAVMDLVVQSQSHNIDLTIDTECELTMDVLRHELLQRVSHLYIFACG